MQSSQIHNLRHLATQWLRLDQDESTRSEIEQLLAAKKFPELEDRLGRRLTFGTAGLRGRMGAGFSRLNSLTIIQTSQGLAEYILSHHPTAQKSGVVIGCDARHNSKRFAEQVATVFLSKGFRVWWFGTTVHTPLVPFTVKKSQAAVGVMVTASHNPAQDNGYKVYGANGCQINAPVDQEITASILMNLEPLTWGQSSPSIAIAENRMILIRQKMLRLYTEEIVSFGTELGGYVRNKPPAFVYTPMHGVGYDYLDHVLQEMAHRSIMEASMSVVQEQNRPDPDFPTIRYPNPEEDGALDLAKAKADSLGRRIIIANDPDADRLAVAEKVDGKWIQFTGDQVGVLLGYYLISNMSRTPGGKVRMSKSYMLASAVSSQMLSRIISATALSFGETLTGFKWLGTKALLLQNQGHPCLFAYEEALGYMFPSIVRDKDGILAATVFLLACSQWQSPWATLQSLYKTYGYYVTRNTYWKSTKLSTAAELFQGIRPHGEQYPGTVANRKVLRWRDLGANYDSSMENTKKVDLPCEPGTQMITCWLDGVDDDGVRVTARASGTEPKIKLYLECVSKDYNTAKKGALTTLVALSQEWFDHPDLKIEEKYAALVS